MKESTHLPASGPVPAQAPGQTPGQIKDRRAGRDPHDPSRPERRSGADPLKRREFIPRSLSQRQGHPLFFSWRLSQCLLGFGCFGETALGLSVVLLASKVPLCPRWGLCPQ